MTIRCTVRLEKTTRHLWSEYLRFMTGEKRDEDEENSSGEEKIE